MDISSCVDQESLALPELCCNTREWGSYLWICGVSVVFQHPDATHSLSHIPYLCLDVLNCCGGLKPGTPIFLYSEFEIPDYWQWLIGSSFAPQLSLLLIKLQRRRFLSFEGGQWFKRTLKRLQTFEATMLRGLRHSLSFQFWKLATKENTTMDHKKDGTNVEPIPIPAGAASSLAQAIKAVQAGKVNEVDIAALILSENVDMISDTPWTPKEDKTLIRKVDWRLIPIVSHRNLMQRQSLTWSSYSYVPLYQVWTKSLCRQRQFMTSRQTWTSPDRSTRGSARLHSLEA